MQLRVETLRPLFFFGALSLLPLASLASFWSFVLRARATLGRWPEPYNPDPKELGFVLHWTITWFLLPAAAVSLAGLLAAIPLRREFLKSPTSSLVGGICFVVSYGTFWLWQALDPGRFIYWFVD